MKYSQIVIIGQSTLPKMHKISEILTNRNFCKIKSQSYFVKVKVKAMEQETLAKLGIFGEKLICSMVQVMFARKTVQRSTCDPKRPGI